MQIKYKLNHSLFIFGLMILFFSAAFPLVQAQSVAPGDLDTTFGSGGKVITAITSDNDGPTRARIQPDGKIVTVGYAADNDFGFTYNAFIVRHNADGTVDNSFGTNGSVVVDSDSYEIYFTDFVILPDGKLLVTANKSTTTTDLVIYRYISNGTLDAAFGTNGVITTPLGNNTREHRIVLQPDGKFVVASYAGSGGVAVVRYNPNGTLDGTFGIGGITRTLVGNSTYPGVSEILVQTDGKLLVAGEAFSGINTDIFVLRYNPNGTLDNSFGANGAVQTDVDNLYNVVGGMALQPDGRIIVNGSNHNHSLVNNPIVSSSVVRYNANGTLDNTFGTNGIVRITEPPSQYPEGIASALAIQQNGKILTAGGRNRTFAISRYNSNGTIDTSFGTNGVVVTPIGNILGGISSIALQTDGKIVAVGSTHVDGLRDVALVRYLGDAVTTAPRTRFDFDGDGRSDISVFRPSDGVWYLNRSGSGPTAAQFGLSTDKITPADFDGDGKTDIAVYRDGIWYWLNSSNGNFNAYQFGVAGDVPMPADYLGDGRAELAVFRPSDRVWYIFNLANNQFSATQFGISTDKPVPADFDGDGKTDIAVYRDGIWYWLRSSDNGFQAVQFGLASDKPTVGDYDGDGKADQAVFRPSDRVWYILGSTQGFYGIQFGISSDIPAAADYDGDGKADIAVFRDGTWYLLQSTAGYTGVAFGLATDKPVPNAFVP